MTHLFRVLKSWSVFLLLKCAIFHTFPELILLNQRSNVSSYMSDFGNTSSLISDIILIVEMWVHVYCVYDLSCVYVFMYITCTYIIMYVYTKLILHYMYYYVCNECTCYECICLMWVCTYHIDNNHSLFLYFSVNTLSD